MTKRMSHAEICQILGAVTKDLPLPPNTATREWVCTSWGYHPAYKRIDDEGVEHRFYAVYSCFIDCVELPIRRAHGEPVSKMMASQIDISPAEFRENWKHWVRSEMVGAVPTRFVDLVIARFEGAVESLKEMMPE